MGKEAIANGRLISVSVARTLPRVASSRARPHESGDTECGVGKEVLLMGVNKKKGRGVRRRSRCQAGYLPGGVSSYCAEPAREEVDGLLLCEGHALEARLEGQIACWDEMLFHIGLWSREASRQERTGIVELLDAERVEATAAIDRACEELDTLRGERTPVAATPGCGEFSRRYSLPPEAARPSSRGLRRSRRR
jgi:hypothetical protein